MEKRENGFRRSGILKRSEGQDRLKHSSNRSFLYHQIALVAVQHLEDLLLRAGLGVHVDEEERAVRRAFAFVAEHLERAAFRDQRERGVLDGQRVGHGVFRVRFGQDRAVERARPVAEAVVRRVEPDHPLRFAVDVHLDEIGVEDHAALHGGVVDHDRSGVVLRVRRLHSAEAELFETRACRGVQTFAFFVARRIAVRARRRAHEIEQQSAALGDRNAQLSLFVGRGKIVGHDRRFRFAVERERAVRKEVLRDARRLRLADRFVRKTQRLRLLAAFGERSVVQERRIVRKVLLVGLGVEAVFARGRKAAVDAAAVVRRGQVRAAGAKRAEGFELPAGEHLSGEHAVHQRIGIVAGARQKLHEPRIVGIGDRQKAQRARRARGETADLGKALREACGRGRRVQLAERDGQVVEIVRKRAVRAFGLRFDDAPLFRDRFALPEKGNGHHREPDEQDRGKAEQPDFLG